MKHQLLIALAALSLWGCRNETSDQPQPQPAPPTKEVRLLHTAGPAGNLLPLDLRIRNISPTGPLTVTIGGLPATIVFHTDTLVRVTAPAALKNGQHTVTLTDGATTYPVTGTYEVRGAGLIASGMHTQGILLVDPREHISQPRNVLPTPRVEDWGIFMATQQTPEGIYYSDIKRVHFWSRATNSAIKLDSEDIGYVTSMTLDHKRGRLYVAHYAKDGMEILVKEPGAMELKPFYVPAVPAEREMEINQLQVDTVSGDIFFTLTNFRNTYLLRRIDLTGQQQRYSYQVAAGSDFDNYRSFTLIPGTDSVLSVVIESVGFTGAVQKARLGAAMTWQPVATTPEQRWIMPATPLEYDAKARSLYIGDFTGRLLRVQVDRKQTEELFRLNSGEWYWSLGLLN